MNDHNDGNNKVIRMITVVRIITAIILIGEI